MTVTFVKKSFTSPLTVRKSTWTLHAIFLKRVVHALSLHQWEKVSRIDE